MKDEIESKIDFHLIQEKMRKFHQGSGFRRLPNCLILPAEFQVYNVDKISEMFGVRVVWGSVPEPLVCMVFD